MRLFRFMELDTCPLCGGELHSKPNPYLGERDVMEIPVATVFELRCMDDTGTNLACGLFRIQRRSIRQSPDDWVCEYLLNESPHPLEMIGE